MKIEICTVKYEDKQVLANLLELYNYDFTEFDPEDVNEHGLYGYKFLDNYWTEEERYPYIIRVDDKIAGFALVSKVCAESKLSDESKFSAEMYHSMCEFFILKKYRHNGIGLYAAHKLFDMHRGEWQVAQIEENKPAQYFWRKVISEYTSGSYEEIRKEDWPGPVQRFVSKK